MRATAPHPLAPLALAGLVFLGLAPAARGQEAGDDAPAEGEVHRLEPITVTARRQLEDQQDVPQSLTNLRGEELERSGVRTVDEAAQYVPNLHVVGFNSPRLLFPFIRGVGSGQGDPAVVTYVDGVPQLTGSSASVTLLDIERMEVLRGAQGTLYGRNALGGVIHIVSRTPPARPTILGRSTIGNFDLQEYTLGAGGPVLTDAVRLGAIAQYARRDGYTENDVTGNDIDERESIAGRGQVVLYPSDALEVRLIFAGERARDGGFTLFDLETLRDRPHHVRYDFEGETERDLFAGTLQLRADLGAVLIESATGLQTLDAKERSDFDFSELDIVRRTTPEELTQLTQEVRVGTSPEGAHELADGLELGWLVGALAFYGEAERGFANELRPFGALIGAFPLAGTDVSASEEKDAGVAAYAQVRLGLFERLDVAAGLRFDFEEKKVRVENAFEVGGAPIFPPSVRRDERDDRELSPSVEVAYHVTDEAMVYARAARGFKAGGFNARVPSGGLDFDPERSWTFEGGVKTTWLDGRIHLNASAFWLRWDDMQLTLFDPVIGGFVANAGEAESWGFEVEALARPFRWLDIFGGWGWTRTRFREFEDPFLGDARGNDLPLAPRFTVHAGLEVRFEVAERIDLFARVEEVVVGRYAYDAANLEEQGSYALTHARAGIRGERWSLEAWMKNAFDEEYFPLAFAAGSGFVGNSGAPRTFGVTAGFRF